MEAIDSEWLREALLLSFTLASSNSTSPRPPQRDPRLIKLAEGILYSRRLILTYHAVILGTIVLISGVHWTKRLILRKRRWTSQRGRRALDVDAEGNSPTLGPVPFFHLSRPESKGIYSSGSSTLDGTASPPQKDADQDEQSPLLARDHFPRPSSAPRSLVSSLQAVWMYQPPPLPVLNKVLPANGTIFMVLAFAGLNFFYTFYHINFNLFELFVLADRCGLVFVANLPLLYLLAAKTQPLKLLTGRSYESLNIFHRRLGELLCLEAFLHVAGMVGAWYVLIRPNGFGLMRFLLLKMCLLGMGAFLAYELLYLTSLSSFRQRWYELFLLSHVVLQVAALIFVFFHHPSARVYVAAALAIFLLDRVVYRLGVKSVHVEAETKILEDEDTVRLSMVIPQRPASFLSVVFGQSVETGWQATDHVFVTIPSLSRRHRLQAHPFTIASAAPTAGTDRARLDLLIRAQNGFSRDLLNATRLHKQLAIRVDGPYGSAHSRELLEGSDLALLVAGGSGIAVCWPLVHYLLDANPVDAEAGTAFALRKQKIILIWVIHEGAHLSWLGRQVLADADYRGVEILVPRATEEIGRPDLAGMMHDIINMYAGRRKDRIRVVTSGPDGMGRLVRNTCASLVRDGRDVDVTVEKFGW
jgi:predicted ferric reductase